ncbi:hypothetical protein KCP76_16815 [Salmonella enterica subsp. enterica serovar Weltevreden]|nr:hypothetical protein KCP76_16815 [Salmonella enterica subsp. enterica serovar Weltevreden]
MATTHALPSGDTGHGANLPYGDLQRLCRRVSLQVASGAAEASGHWRVQPPPGSQAETERRLVSGTHSRRRCYG